MDHLIYASERRIATMRRGVIIAAIAATIATLIILVAILAYSIRPAISQGQAPIQVTYPQNLKYASIQPYGTANVQVQRQANTPKLEEIYLSPSGRYLYLIFDQADLQNYLNQYGGFVICVKVENSQTQKQLYDQCKVVCKDGNVYFYDEEDAKIIDRDKFSKVIFNAHKCCCPGCRRCGQPVGLVIFGFSQYNGGVQPPIQVPFDTSTQITIYIENLPPPSSGS